MAQKGLYEHILPKEEVVQEPMQAILTYEDDQEEEKTYKKMSYF